MTKTKTKNTVMSHARAVLAMHACARLCRMHEKGELVWFIAPTTARGDGGRVTDATASKLIAQSKVIGGDDGLWSGCDQTYRIRATVEASRG
jgi:hypothetical protein